MSKTSVPSGREMLSDPGGSVGHQAQPLPQPALMLRLEALLHLSSCICREANIDLEADPGKGRSCLINASAPFLLTLQGPLALLMEFCILAPAGKMDLRCTFAFLTWEHASPCYSDIQRGFSHTQPQAQLKPSENKHTNFWGLLMEMLFSPSAWQQRSCLCSTSFSCACHPHISCSFLLARGGGLNSGTDFNSQWINTGVKSNILTVFPVNLGFV